MNVLEIVHHDTLTSLLTSSHIVVLDFTAPWCGPCKQALPAYLNLAQEFPEATFVKLNVDDVDPEITTAFNVTSVPAFAVVVNGKTKRMWRGYDAGRTIEEIREVVKGE